MICGRHASRAIVCIPGAPITLDLINHDRRLSIRSAEFDSIYDPSSQALVIVVGPAVGFSPRQKLVADKIYGVVIVLVRSVPFIGGTIYDIPFVPVRGGGGSRSVLVQILREKVCV